MSAPKRTIGSLPASVRVSLVREVTGWRSGAGAIKYMSAGVVETIGTFITFIYENPPPDNTSPEWTESTNDHLHKLADAVEDAAEVVQKFRSLIELACTRARAGFLTEDEFRLVKAEWKNVCVPAAALADRVAAELVEYGAHRVCLAVSDAWVNVMREIVRGIEEGPDGFGEPDGEAEE